MAIDDQNPPDAEQDPSEDTPDLEAEEGAEATEQPGSDQDARYAEAQKTITRQAQELALYRKGEQAAPDPGEQNVAAGNDAYQAGLEADSWALAEQVYGTEAIAAYTAAAQLIEKATTPADHLAAFEAYHSIRSGESEAPAEGAAAMPTRGQALTPKVDANRSDLGPDLQEADEKLAEARKGNSLVDFAAAATQRMGFGRAKS